MTLTPHQPQELFDDVEEAQIKTIPYMRSSVMAQPMFDEVVRKMADHPECFVPGCDDERHKSIFSKHGDGWTLTCFEHKQNHAAINQAMDVKRRWLRGEDV